MSRESSPTSKQEVYDIKTLSSQGKMKILLEIFELAEDKSQVEEKKKRFLELVKQYFEVSTIAKARVQVGETYAASKSSKKRNEESSSSSNRHKAEIHNKIMDIITGMSLSLKLNPTQRELAVYLAEDRKRVEEMINKYYLNFDTSNVRQHDEIHRALRGDGYFTSPPGKDD